MELWTVYRDVMGFPRKQFEILPTPKAGDLLIKDMVMPGMFDVPTMYVRRHRVEMGEDVVNLVTYTEIELEDDDVQALAKEALARGKNERR